MGSQKVKSVLINLLKISVACGLLWYLTQSGRLDFTELLKVFSDPFIAFATVSFWLICPSILGSIRWRFLLNGSGYQVSPMRAFHLQIMGFFFNTAMPGAVGGDLIKVIYVIKENPDRGKTPAIMSIFLDRVIGLSALFFIGLTAALINITEFMAEPILFSFFITLVLFCSAIAIFFFASLYQWKKDPFEAILKAKIPGFPQILKIYDALRAFRFKRVVIFKCFALSFVIQIAALYLFYIMTNALLSDPAPIGKIASIFPVGVLSTALPVSPGGLGVGHLAFERLFNMVGLTNGANIANAYMLSLLALNLVGVISYLRYKREPVDQGVLEATTP